MIWSSGVGSRGRPGWGPDGLLRGSRRGLVPALQPAPPLLEYWGAALQSYYVTTTKSNSISGCTRSSTRDVLAHGLPANALLKEYVAVVQQHTAPLLYYTYSKEMQHSWSTSIREPSALCATTAEPQQLQHHEHTSSATATCCLLL